MKLSVLQEDLLQALTTASRFVSVRAQLPVLSNVLFNAEKGKLRLSATNLETGISYEIGAKVDEEGKISVPAKMVVELVANTPPGKIEIKENKGGLDFSTGAFSISLAGIPANEFPSVPYEKKERTFSVKRSFLQEVARKISFSASDDESRPSLNGVLLEAGDKTRAVATDGFRLSLKEFEDKALKKQGKRKLLIPARVIIELSKILTKEDEVSVSLLEKEGQVLFSGDSVVLTGRLLEGEFPNYARIIPQKTNHQATVDKEELLRAVRAVAVFAREEASVLRLRLEKNKIVVKAESQQYGKEEVVVDAKTKGGEVEIAFNYRYLLDFLASIDGEEVSFETEGATSPGVFKDTQDPDFLHLIMPVRIQS